MTSREEVKERVRDAADIVQIIGESVTLKRMGATYRGACPFHNGKDRNFSVNPKLGIYKCFVCGEKGDVFSFLQKRFGLDFPSALRAVAEKSGIELPKYDPRQAAAPDPREPQWEALAAAAEFFRRMLWEDPAGEPARAYLASRHVDQVTADHFALGFAPDGKRVIAHLRDLGFTDARLTDVGLLTAPDDGRDPAPRFWNRLIFPIFDPAGHVVGFGGRALGSAKPKYLNSPDSPIFSKSTLLYGLNWAKLGIRREAKAILVEGYFDLLRVSAAGIDAVVASMGTALTAAQAHLLARYTKHVFIAYDSDQPGLRATFRSADALLEHGVRVRVVMLPGGDDPDTFVATHGAQAFESELDRALDVFDRKVQFLERGGWFADLDHKRRAIDKLLPTIRVTADPITRQLYVGRLSEASGVSAETLWREIGGADAVDRSRAPGAADAEDVADAPAPRRADRRRRPADVGAAAERALVRTMLAARALIEPVTERLDALALRDPHYRAIFDALLQLGPDATIEELAGLLDPDDVELVQEMQAEGTMGADPGRVVDDSLARLQKRDLHEQLQAKQRQFSVASPAEQDELLREITRIKSEEQALLAPSSSILGKSSQRRRGAP